MSKGKAILAIIAALIIGFWIGYQAVVSTMQIVGYPDGSVDITIMGETHTY